MDTNLQSAGLTKSEKIKWGIVVLVMLILAVLPAGEVYTSQVKIFLIITLAGILVVAFELMDVIVPSILMMFAYALTGVCETAIAFQGMTTSTVYITLGCLVLVAALEESGLLTRVSYWIMIRAGGSFRGIVWGIFAASLITSFMTMGNTFALMAAFAVGCIGAMNLQNTKASSAIGLVVCIGTIAVRSLVYSPMLVAVQVAQTRVEIPDFALTFPSVLLHNWLFLVPMVLMVMILIKCCHPENELSGREYFVEKYRELGEITAREKKASAVLFIIVGWMLFAQLIPLSSDYALILVPWLMFFPGIHVATANAIKKVNFSIVFFTAGCFSIGNVASSLGLGQMIADRLLPVISGWGPVGVLALIYLATALLNLVMTPYAIHACMTVPLIAIGLQIGVSPLLVNYMLMHGSDAIILPYEYTPYLVVFGLGMIKMKDFTRYMAVKLVITAGFLFAVVVPYWKLLGLF